MDWRSPSFYKINKHLGLVFPLNTGEQIGSPCRKTEREPLGMGAAWRHRGGDRERHCGRGRTQASHLWAALLAENCSAGLTQCRRKERPPMNKWPRTMRFVYRKATSTDHSSELTSTCWMDCLTEIRLILDNFGISWIRFEPGFGGLGPASLGLTLDEVSPGFA